MYKSHIPGLITAVLLAEVGAEVAGAATASAPIVAPTSPVANTILKSQKFIFRKDRVLGEKRATVELAIPIPTAEALLEALSDEKQQAYLLELVANDIIANARLQVGDDKKPVNKQEELDYSKLSIAYIANLPPAERRGGGISKEVWEDFFSDYVAIMPAILGKPVENVENAGKLFVARLQPVKTQKKILKVLGDYLNLWFTSTKQQEELAEVYEFLSEKVKDFMSRDEAELLVNL